ncbi:hypothetical protein ASZ90_015053 [hydrocarbon metagenome]|uniref:Uncharacterized protein n=1 Tax=hydrocarbon metagenome TaxID=938273 RepID=A0A0W8F323_9ZZZZ
MHPIGLIKDRSRTLVQASHVACRSLYPGEDGYQGTVNPGPGDPHPHSRFISSGTRALLPENKNDAIRSRLDA